jgi:hypothetical protein
MSPLLRRALVVAALAVPAAAIVTWQIPMCPTAVFLGLPCPGCGLTRATLALGRGDLGEALRLHPLVLVLAPVFIGFMVRAAWEYVRGPARRAAPLNPKATGRAVSVAALLLLVVMLGVWAARFFGHLGGPAHVETMRDFVSRMSRQATSVTR